VSKILTGIFEEIKVTITSFGLSKMMSAGRNLAFVKSVKGKGKRTIFPFIDI